MIADCMSRLTALTSVDDDVMLDEEGDAPMMLLAGGDLMDLLPRF